MKSGPPDQRFIFKGENTVQGFFNTHGVQGFFNTHNILKIATVITPEIRNSE